MFANKRVDGMSPVPENMAFVNKNVFRNKYVYENVSQN